MDTLYVYEQMDAKNVVELCQNCAYWPLLFDKNAYWFMRFKDGQSNKRI